MPTRKQRRRRDKDFRHDVRVFEIDEEGNETPISALRALEEKEKPRLEKKSAAPVKSRSGRTMREVQPPTWDRAFTRGGLMRALMLLVFIFFQTNGSIVTRIVIPAFYAVAFVPLTYWIDRTAYRSYLKRSGAQSPAKKTKQPAAKKS